MSSIGFVFDTATNRDLDEILLISCLILVKFDRINCALSMIKKFVNFIETNAKQVFKMVQIHLKRADESLFLYSAPAATPLSDLTPTLASLHNDRKRLDRLVTAIPDLLQYGPSKPESQQGYTEEQIDELAKQSEPKKGKEVMMNGFAFYETTCPIGMRVGLAAGEDATKLVESTLVEANKIISKVFWTN